MISTKSGMFRITIFLIAIFLLSFTLRWQYVKNTEIINPIRADAYQYVAIANNLATHGLFTSADPPLQSTPETRPPGYCYFLAGVFKATGSFSSFYLKTLAIQCFLGALTVVLTYFLARFFLSPWLAFIPAILVTFSPHMIAMSAFFLSESLYTFLQLGSLVLFLHAFQRRNIPYYLLAGAGFSLGIFVRPTLAVFPLICAFTVFITQYWWVKDKETLKKWAFASLAFLIISYSSFAGWSLWKQHSFGARSTVKIPY